MGLRKWISGLRRSEDEAALRDAEEASTESDRERAELSDIEGTMADNTAFERGFGRPPDEFERPKY
jgi:hypothetical protein